jgi:hypothetical protein
LQKAKQHHKACKDNQEKVATMKIGVQERTSLKGGQTFHEDDDHHAQRESYKARKSTEK